ncbi:MAG: DAK2 domain-containing protein [Chloroflexota bacterium]|nr:DAK2 domain-containing protein [Chloroflexota bacterium]
MTENTVVKRGLDAEDYIQLIKVFTLSLEEHREVMNSLNVFPVPDADTGTNMYISVKGIVDNLDRADPYQDLNLLSKDVADFALLSAQGNSGLLIAQLFRGIHKGVSSSNILGLSELAGSLQQSYEYAFNSIHEPQEGTMITVMRECAKIASKYSDTNSTNFKKVLEAISSRAKTAVEETKSQMDLLRQADVIDSGAYGFSVMLEAAYNCVESDENGNVNLRVDGTNSFIPEIPNYYSPKEDFFQSSSHDEDWGYCVVFAITGDDLDVEKIKDNLSDKGRSLVVTGSEKVCKIHIHSEDPDEVINFSKNFGNISNENITNMDEQYKEMKENISSQVSSEISLIVSAEGEGIISFLEDNTFGSIKVLSNSDLDNISNEDFGSIIDDLSSKEIICIPNSESSFEKFKNFSESVEKINLVNSFNDAQLISAIFSFSPEQDLDNNLSIIRSSVDDCKSFEVTKGDFDDKESFVKRLKDDNLTGDFVSIIYHESSPQEHIEFIQGILSEEFGVNDTELISHSSKLYYFTLLVE